MLAPDRGIAVGQVLRSVRLCTAALLLAGAVPGSAASIAGRPEVVDGDGLTFGPIAIRLHGVDAPEIGQHCARADGGTWDCGGTAAERLAELIEGLDVECQPLDRDLYGRIVARCFADEHDLSAVLAAEGAAWAFVRYSDDYVPEEAGARAAHLGVWQAETQAPWDYRANRWERAATASPMTGCPIKGNINAEGERIYHTPWSPWYGRTKINEAAGEQWFCDEAEAIAAGWRPARFR